MPIIIGLAGPGGAGKQDLLSEIATHLPREMKARVIKASSPLRALWTISAFTEGLNAEERQRWAIMDTLMRIFPPPFQENSPTIRDLYAVVDSLMLIVPAGQTQPDRRSLHVLGDTIDEVGSALTDNLNKNLSINVMEAKDSDSTELIIVPDIRTTQEAEVVRRIGGYIYVLEAPFNFRAQALADRGEDRITANLGHPKENETIDTQLITDTFDTSITGIEQVAKVIMENHDLVSSQPEEERDGEEIDTTESV